LVRLEFQYKESVSDAIHTTSGWMTLDPEQYWQATESDVERKTKQSSGGYHVKYEFTKLEGDFPVIRRSTAQSQGFDAGGRQHLLRMTVEWNCREDAAVPEREFKLSAFGLAEPMQ